MALIAGLDVGTTGCKATVYHPEEPQYLSLVYADHPVSHTSSMHEMDADAIQSFAESLP